MPDLLNALRLAESEATTRVAEARQKLDEANVANRPRSPIGFRRPSGVVASSLWAISIFPRYVIFFLVAPHLLLSYKLAQLRWIAKAARAFVAFHRSGRVAPEVESRRLKICLPCEFRTNHGRCAKQLSSCGCPKSRAWIFTRLSWLARFRAFSCPIDRFPESTS